VAFHDEWFVPSGTPIAAAATTNGAVAVSAAFASLLTRTSVSGESLLTVANGNPGNAINVYTLSGLAIGPQQDLPVEPDARIPLGGGFYLIKPAFGTLEAVAVDETTSNEVIYLGDEDNSMVHVLTPGFLVGDFDEDGDVDQDDRDQLVSCFTGPGGGPIDPACAPGDADVDDEIDCDDWDALTENWTGPPVQPPPVWQCAQAQAPSVSKGGIVVLALPVFAGGAWLLERRRTLLV